MSDLCKTHIWSDTKKFANICNDYVRDRYLQCEKSIVFDSVNKFWTPRKKDKTLTEIRVQIKVMELGNEATAVV